MDVKIHHRLLVYLPLHLLVCRVAGRRPHAGWRGRRGRQGQANRPFTLQNLHTDGTRPLYKCNKSVTCLALHPFNGLFGRYRLLSSFLYSCPHLGDLLGSVFYFFEYAYASCCADNLLFVICQQANKQIL